MTLETLGLKHLSVTENVARANDSYSRTDRDAKRLGLDDNRTIGKNEAADGTNGTHESKYELDGTLKEEHGGEKDKAVTGDEKPFDKISLDGTEKTDETEKTGKLSLGGKTEGKREAHSEGKHDGFEKDCPLCQCKTCRERRYKDGSDDSGVSFQQATKIAPSMVASQVRKHEMEHVRREQYKAKDEGKEIISQSVRIKTSICPECGKTYVSGGETRTSKRTMPDAYHELFRVGAEDALKKGEEVDMSA